MKNKIFNILLICILISLSLLLVGCGNNKNEEQQTSNNNGTKNTEVQSISENFNEISDFNDDGLAIVTKSENYKAINYIIDKNFNVLSSYEGNGEFIDGYVQVDDKNDKNKFYIVDAYGNTVFSYSKIEYEKVELVDQGCLIIEKQSDTYNSSTRVAGVYDLKQQKFILEPHEKYSGKIRKFGDDILYLDDSKEFYNLKTKQVITFEENIPMEEFEDGYSINDDTDNNAQRFLIVYDDKGNIRKINSPENSATIFNKFSNGMCYVVESGGDNNTVRTLSALYDLEKGTSKQLDDEFWLVHNKPEYTKDGYALIYFCNQGSTDYYTVIDREGNKLFEPQKVNDNSAFQPDDNGEKRKMVSKNLYEGNYFVVDEEGVQKIVNKENEIVATAKEGENFEGVTNNAIKVRFEQKGKPDVFYYRDFDGNKININKKQ